MFIATLKLYILLLYLCIFENPLFLFVRKNGS